MRRVKIIDKIVRPTKSKMALAAKIKDCVENGKLEMCRTRKAVTIRSPDLLDWSSVTESAPRSPINITPSKSRALIQICRIAAATTFRWSPLERTYIERPIILLRHLSRIWFNLTPVLLKSFIQL